MAEQLVQSVKKSYKMYKRLLSIAFSLIVVIFVVSGILLAYGQMGMSVQSTYAQQNELADVGGRSKILSFTSAFYFISPLTAIQLGVLVVGIALGVLTFNYVEPDMNQFITDEINTLGFGIQRKFFRKYTIFTKNGKIFLKFVPYRRDSIEWCLFKLESPIDGKRTEGPKNELEEITLRHMLNLKEDKISVVCNIEELFFKLLLMTKALGEIRQNRRN